MAVAASPAVNGNRVNGDHEMTNGANGFANGFANHSTPAHPTFDSIPDVIRAVGTSAPLPSLPLSHA
jgi:hypothetical protein